MKFRNLYYANKFVTAKVQLISIALNSIGNAMKNGGAGVEYIEVNYLQIQHT